MQKRRYHATRIRPREIVSSTTILPEPSSATSAQKSTPGHLFDAYGSRVILPIDNAPQKKKKTIRQRLEEWNLENGTPNSDILTSFERYPLPRDMLDGVAQDDGMIDDNVAEAIEEFEIEDYESLGDLNLRAMYLSRGDLAEITYHNTEPILGVYIQNFGNQYQFYCINGMYIHRGTAQIRFVIRNWIDPSLLDPILPYLPTKELTEEFLLTAKNLDISVPRKFGAPIIEKLVEVWRESEDIYRENASILDNAYETLSHESNTNIMTLEEIARSLLVPDECGDTSVGISHAMLLAVRKALFHAGFKVWADPRSQRTTQQYTIRPRNEVQAMELVQQWIRGYQEYLAICGKRGQLNLPKPNAASYQGANQMISFITKAKELISFSRTLRDPTPYGNVGPSKTQYAIGPSSSAMRTHKSLNFTSSDQLIITFLESWTLSNKFKGLNTFRALGPAILNAVGCYKDYKLNTSTGFMFLQEIGVLAPYENKVAYDEGLMLPSARFSRQLHLITTMAFKKRRNPGFVDSMADIRRDFGNTTVFCIDGADASEIDDGISIEKIGNTSTFWVSIHIANPTAFFDKKHVLAVLAEHMTETVYMPERAYSMLPRWSTASHFSLGQDRATLTFSAKLDTSGNILETKIEPGVIRNVVYITPETLSQYVDSNVVSDYQMMKVGGEVPPKFERPVLRKTLFPAQINALLNLNMLANARYNQRRKAGGLFMDSAYPEVTVYETESRPGLSYTKPFHDAAHFIKGDPVIELKAPRFKNWFDDRARPNKLVQEMMLLACEIGATWCSQRNIPIIFRGSFRIPGMMPLSQFEEEIFKPSLDSHGVPPMRIGLEWMKQMGNTSAFTEPISHKFLGLPLYAKVTSPLRRYGDMVVHWQIEAALREEAKRGKSLIGETSHDYLPFSKPEVDKILTRLLPRERMITKAKRYASLFWEGQFFLRAHYFKQMELPETFRVMVFTTMQTGKLKGVCQVLSLDWTIIFEMFQSGDLEEARVGDIWEVRFDILDVFSRAKVVKPIRLISRDG